MKVTWKGEPGGPDFVERTDPVTGKVYRFRPGKPVDVPETLGIGAFLGNPFFEADAAKGAVEDDAEAKKAAAVKAAEQDVAEAQNDLGKANDANAKEAAGKRLDAAKARLEAAKKG